MYAFKEIINFMLSQSELIHHFGVEIEFETPDIRNINFVLQIV